MTIYILKLNSRNEIYIWVKFGVCRRVACCGKMAKESAKSEALSQVPAVDLPRTWSISITSKKLMISSWFIEPKFWNIYNIYIPHRFAGISQQHPFFGSYGSWGRGAWGFVAISWRWLGTRVSWPKVAWSGLARCCWVWQIAGSWCNVAQLCRWISPVDFTSKEQHGSQKRCFAIPGQVFIWI